MAKQTRKEKIARLEYALRLAERHGNERMAEQSRRILAKLKRTH